MFISAFVLASLLVMVILPNSEKSSYLVDIQKRLGLSDVPEALFAVALFAWGGLFIALLFGVFGTFGQILFNLAPDDPGDPQKVGEWRFQLLALTAFTATLSAVVALPFTLLRTQFTSRQTKTSEDRIELDRENELTDRIYKAVEGLGSERTMTRMGRFVIVTSKNHPDAPPGREVEWQDSPMTRDPEKFGYEDEPWTAMTETQPNIEVRIGAIYMLERLAHNNLPVHVQIMEILCAYIRENAPATKAAAPPSEEPSQQHLERVEPGPSYLLWPRIRKWHDGHVASWKHKKAQPPRSDIATVLEVLSRREPEQRDTEAEYREGSGAWVFSQAMSPYSKDDSPEGYCEIIEAYRERLRAYKGYRPDLRGTNLQCANLDGYDLRGWRLNDARLEAASLKGAKVHGADLADVKLQGADLTGAEMQGTCLRNAGMQGAKLGRAQMQGADLRHARMVGADLEATRMQGADFGGAMMTGVSLELAELQGADLRPASPKGVNRNDRDSLSDKATSTGLHQANLKAVQMEGAKLTDVSFLEANLEQANFRGACLLGVTLKRTHLHRTQFQGTDIRGADFGNDYQQDEIPSLDTAVLRGSFWGSHNDKSIREETVAKVESRRYDFFAAGTMHIEAADRPSHWLPEGFDGNAEQEWRNWQATLPKGWDETWPEDGFPMSIGVSTYWNNIRTPESRDFWTRWNAWLAEQGAPPRTFD